MNQYANKALELARRVPTEQYLLALAAVLCVLVLTQGVQCAGTYIGTNTTLNALERIKQTPSRKIDLAKDKYKTILTKGVLGRVPEPGEVRVFGILGKSALFGPSPDSVQPYEVGADIPNVGKLVRVEVDKVTVEKEGKERTLLVFAEGPPGAAPPPPSAAPPPGRPPQMEGGHRPPRGPGGPGMPGAPTGPGEENKGGPQPPQPR